MKYRLLVKRYVINSLRIMTKKAVKYINYLLGKFLHLREHLGKYLYQKLKIT